MHIDAVIQGGLVVLALLDQWILGMEEAGFTYWPSPQQSKLLYLVNMKAVTTAYVRKHK